MFTLSIIGWEIINTLPIIWMFFTAYMGDMYLTFWVQWLFLGLMGIPVQYLAATYEEIYYLKKKLVD